ncbi:CHAT domain-containing protein [Actinacidiphila paucisporea]|uniref:CHAT domain-containing protein n=1 Tax=Actinacidiphila paucisporea TaxID=310782 RepID=A0A1M6USV1_9ACTN|nr:CHAT domain-containing protein [Actinacidiphila paucisporea]SHK72279.1 CHAT domain-containing protein [Actinacidiphila paucisporea]
MSGPDRPEWYDPPEGIEGAVRSAQARLDRSSGRWERLDALMALVASLYRRHMEHGDPADLDRAIALTREALAQVPASDRENQEIGARQLALMLFRTGTAADRAEAGRLLRAGRAHRDPRSPAYGETQGLLGAIAFADHTAGGGRRPLDEAVAFLREAVRTQPSGTPEYATHQANLGCALCYCYRDFGASDADLDEGIALLEDLAPGRTTPSARLLAPNMAAVVRANLIAALDARHNRRGDPADARRARALAEDPRAARETGDWQSRGTRLGAEASLAFNRYQSTGGLYDLERALSAQQAALDALTQDDGRRPDTLLNLAFLHHSQAEALRSDPAAASAHLDTALRLARECVAHSPSPTARAVLGKCLLSLHNTDQAAHSAALDDAVAHLRRAVAGSGDSPRLDANARASLADALTARFIRDQSPQDLAEATSLLETTGRRDSADTAGVAATLAVMQVVMASVTEDAEALRAARTRLREALTALEGRSAGIAFDIAQVWLRMEWQTWRVAAGLAPGAAVPARPPAPGMPAPGASFSDVVFADPAAARRRATAGVAESGRRIVEILHGLVDTQLGREHKERSIISAAGTGAQGAYALSRSGEPDALRQAVVLLEAGRALMLSEVLERGTAELDALADPALLACYREATERLADAERAVLASSTAPGGDVAPEPGRPGRLMRTLEDAREQWRAQVDRVRALPGFHDFLRPPAFEALAAVVRRLGCPVVFLCATELGGVALLMDPADPAAVAAVDLPLLSRDWEERTAAAWLREASAEVPDEQAVDDLSYELWTRVMGPVADALGDCREVVLIPGGQLALLPLHAAGRPDPGAVTGWHHVLDRTAVRYAPTVRSLGASLDRCRDLPGDALRLLAVADPAPTGAPRLPEARDEVAAVACWFPGPETEVLADLAATRDRVAALLAGATVLHVACHADCDPARPLDGGLLLAGDQRLTTRDLLAMTGLRSRLVTLSACSTGVVGAALPDEVVSLATAVLQAGAAGVVASLWEVDSAATLAIMARFYELWRRGGLPVTQALRRAQLWFRDATNAEKQAALPTVTAFAPPPGMSPREQAAWPAERQDAGPLAWSAFFHTGS